MAKKKKLTDKERERIKKNIWRRVEFVEDTIGMHNFAPNQTLSSWIFGLVSDYVCMAEPERQKNRNSAKPYDEVMATAHNLGFALMAWVIRVQLAKAHDPRRSIKSRDRAYAQWVKNIADLIQLTHPDPNEYDKQIFDQKWEKTEYMKGFEPVLTVKLENEN
jgi:hypothetical protein